MTAALSIISSVEAFLLMHIAQKTFDTIGFSLKTITDQYCYQLLLVNIFVYWK